MVVIIVQQVALLIFNSYSLYLQFEYMCNEYASFLFCIVFVEFLIVRCITIAQKVEVKSS